MLSYYVEENQIEMQKMLSMHILLSKMSSCI